MANVVRSKDIAFTNLAMPVIFTPRAVETTRLLDSMAVVPSANYRALINKTFVNIKDAALLPKISFLNMYGLPTFQAAMLDWITPARAAPVITGTVTYNARGSLVPDGSTGYLDLGVSPASLGLTQDSAGASCKFGSGAGPLFGTTSSGGNLFHAIVSTAGSLGTRLNQTAAQDNIPLTGNANTGHVGISRNSAGAYSRYHDGLTLGDAATASSGVAANNIVLFRQGSAYGTHPVSHFALTKGMTAADHAALFQIVANFVEGIAQLN